MKRGKPPNAQEKKWLKLVAEAHPGCVIHHPVGSTKKHNKVHIGNWWIIPMRPWDHNSLHNDGKTFGFDSRKDFEKARFKELFEHPEIIANPKSHPPAREVMAIMDYHL